ncbi:MAG: PepSY domain-containing protein [Nitrospira sp.]|nr:PepSY domain-containing protein [Nitrospira sp.]
MFTRPFWVRLHRWAGLAMAGLLIVVGLTGSLLAFYPELERVAHPHWYPDRDLVTWMGAGELAAQLERAEPRLRVTQISLLGFDGATSAWVEPRLDSATGKPFALGYEYVLLDPATGAVLDRIQWGTLRNGWTGLMSFVYALHYALALDMPGVWILGICALVWTLDCFVGLYLTFPVRRPRETHAHRQPVSIDASWWTRWKRAWIIKPGNAHRVNFDLHRAGGLWLWAALLIFAWSSVYMNLWDTVYTWTTRALFEYHPYWTEFQPRPIPMERPGLNWPDAQAVGERLMATHVAQAGSTVRRPVALRLYREFGIYQYQVETDHEIDDRPRRYTTQVWFDADTGVLRLGLLPRGQYAGNTISNWLYALHMANVFGVPYRIFVCCVGLVVVMLSVTGVYLWAKKRRSKAIAHSRRAGSLLVQAASGVQTEK